MILSNLLFIITYWLTSNGIAFIINLLYKHIIPANKPNFTQRKKKVQQQIKKLGYELGNVPGKLAFGAAIPLSNKVFLSNKLMNKLSYQELQYVIHHEIGHIKLNHPKKLVLFGTVMWGSYYLISTMFNIDNPFFAILMGALLGNYGLFVARIYEEQADDYPLSQIGIDKVKTSLLAFHKLYQTKYDRDYLLRYFDVHLTHLANIDRLEAKTKLQQRSFK